MSADQPYDGRRDTHEDEVLELAGAPRELFARIHRALQRHLRPHTTGGGGPCLTGGGILEARSDHRESRDIDIVIRARTRGDVREALDTAASEAGSYRVEGPEIHRIEFPDHTKDEHVDVSFVKPNPQGGAKQATVDGQKATVLSNAQIMTGSWSTGACTLRRATSSTWPSAACSIHRRSKPRSTRCGRRSRRA